MASERLAHKLFLKIWRKVLIIIKGGDVNPMIPGRKIFAIFGFCDIHNFGVANEVLEEVRLK